MTEAGGQQGASKAVPDGRPYSPLGHRMMFILLTLLAFCLYAPTTLLPVLRDYGGLLAEERRIQATIDRLEKEVRHREGLVKAFAQDAVINERLAILDLQYRKPNEVVLPVLPPGFAPPCLEPPKEPDWASPLKLPNNWPAWALKAEKQAQQYGLIDLFLDPSLTPVLLLMSGGLAVAAFVLFAPDRREVAPSSDDGPPPQQDPSAPSVSQA